MGIASSWKVGHSEPPHHKSFKPLFLTSLLQGCCNFQTYANQGDLTQFKGIPGIREMVPACLFVETESRVFPESSLHMHLPTSSAHNVGLICTAPWKTTLQESLKSKTNYNTPLHLLSCPAPKLSSSPTMVILFTFSYP